MDNLVAKDLWPGMYIGMPDPDGVLCSTPAKVVEVKITETRERNTENPREVLSKSFVLVKYIDRTCLDKAKPKERWFKPTDKVERSFGPDLV